MTIGILGGGQLGRMLALSGYPLGLNFKTFDPSSEAVAGHVAPLLNEDPNDVDALGWFSKGLDVVTYEWENVPVASARFLEQRVPVFPPPRALEVAGDRLKEKSFFRELGVPCPDFWPISTRQDLELATRESGFPCVLKTRRFGYDGKGQMVLHEPSDVARAWDEIGGVPLILEAFVAFDRELSILATRSREGDMRFYPLVGNHHRGGILRLSIAPAPDHTAELQRDAETFAHKIMDKLDYVGTMALELFQVGERLAANEIAPRVHNSGHWTIEGSATSQFENHLRAVAGLPLGSTQMRTPCAAMVNLIGELPELAKVLRIEGAHAHYYGKDVKPNRKVGHVTLVADDDSELKSRVDTILKLLNFREITS
ncbi:N5-carboxyaminoimidazole ribonucleotide synthase [Abditibacteriota bacterium]|nr:N5-carboxyaminoimidazole ribonucleotide synthase [Abditibacteriota bacterium]